MLSRIKLYLGKRRRRGTLESTEFLNAYLTHLHSFTNLQRLSHRRIVVSANSGLAGQVVGRLLVETPSCNLMLNLSGTRIFLLNRP